MTAVLTVGEALVDIVVPHGGGEQSEHVGGSPANVAIGVSALGHDSRLTAYLGVDERGTRVREHVERYGVHLTAGSQSAPHTSTATAHLDADAVATYDFDLRWEVGPQDLDGVGHLHTGSIAATLEPGGSEVVALIERARAGATISYDPNARPTIMGAPEDARQRIEECIGRSDVVKASLEDVQWLYGGPSGDPEDEDAEAVEVVEVVHAWGQLGPQLVVVTRGGDGAVVHLSRDDTTLELPSLTVEVVDTVGAGDSFMSGLLSGLLDAGLLGSPEARDRLARAELEDIAPALERAVACAGWTVARAGAAAPTRADLGLEPAAAH